MQATEGNVFGAPHHGNYLRGRFFFEEPDRRTFSPRLSRSMRRLVRAARRAARAAGYRGEVLSGTYELRSTTARPGKSTIAGYFVELTTNVETLQRGAHGFDRVTGIRVFTDPDGRLVSKTPFQTDYPRD